MNPPRRPHWIDPEEWAALWALHNGAPVCRDCGTSERLSVDHIVPRKLGGPHDLSNLCFRCLRHNCAKGDRPDVYWSKELYFDTQPELRALREFQKRIYLTLTKDEETAEWFSHPASVIAGKLYLIGAVVGAGKTLAIPVIASAWNHLQRKIYSAGYRCDVALVLTKEVAIRDQLAEALRIQVGPDGFGIMPTSPKVSILERFDQLQDETWLSHQDIVVACVHQFWEKKNDKPSKDIVRALGKFPLIILDEVHFGPERVRQILDSTPRSVVFGLTGTPIDRQAEVIKDFVLVAGYTYQDASVLDQSMKFLDGDEEIRDQFVTKVLFSDADLLSGGQPKSISDRGDPEYDPRSLITVRQVAQSLIRYLERLDNSLLGEAAPHWDVSAVTADLWYPAHAKIVVYDQATAETLTRWLNEYFELHRKTYPRRAGWAAEYVLTGDDGQQIKGKRLTTDHPWRLTYKKDVNKRTGRYECDRACARILVTVGMAREGVSNPLCAVVALADDVASIQAVVQHIGRALRTVEWIDPNGVRHVPSRLLDTVHVIYHEAQESTAAGISGALSFILDMDGKFKGLTTVAQLLADEAGRRSPNVPGPQNPLSDEDRFGIAVDAVVAGGDCWRDDPDAVSKVISEAVRKYSRDNDERRDAIEDFVKQIRSERPDSLAAMTGVLTSRDQIRVRSVVLDEREKTDPNDKQLMEYIRWNHPELEPETERNFQLLRGHCLAMYQQWVDSRRMPDMAPTDNLELIRQGYAKVARESLEQWLQGDYGKFKGATHAFVGKAVQTVLGVDERVGNDTKWNCPQVHVLLRRPDVRSDILGYTRGKLIRAGFLPAAAQAMRIEVEADE